MVALSNGDVSSLKAASAAKGVHADKVTSSPVLRADAAPFHQAPSSPILRAEAAPFQPPSSPNLRPEAATFEPPPPGLGFLDFAAPVDSSQKWEAQDGGSSPGSTALPYPGSSPWMCSGSASALGGQGSPWASPYMSPWMAASPADLTEGFAFELPDAQMELSEPAESNLLFVEGGLCAEDAFEDPDTQFTLEGLGSLEDSLTSLLGKFTITPGEGLGEVGATIVAGLSQHHAPKFVSPNASTHGEDASGGLSTPPSTDDQVTESETCESPASTRSTQAMPDSPATPNSVSGSPKRTGWGAKVADPELPPLPARARAVSKPAIVFTSTTSTMILRNVPRRCTPADLEEVLAKAQMIQDVDFLYVPMDLKGKCGVGHAFISFRTEEAGKKFTSIFHGRAAKEIGGKGALEVVSAPIQGREANVQKLQRSGVLMSMLADKPAWLPRLFDSEGAPEVFSTPLN